MVIIGFAGKMGSGKNHFAEKIIAPLLKSQGHQVVILAFADQLKVELMTKYGLSYTEVFENKTASTRDLLQKEGTSLGRDIRGADIWIKYLASWISIFTARGVNHILITDVRFTNEAEWIKSQNGILVKIDAPDRTQNYCIARNISAENRIHQSETQLDTYTDFDVIIDNRLNIQQTDKLETSIGQLLHLIASK